MEHDDHLTKWRLILGAAADPAGDLKLEEQLKGMDDTLAALYDSDRRSGLGSSSPNVNRWLGDIRKYFPSSVVQLLQRDAIERLGLHQMLLEPELLETIEPDVHLIGTLLSLKNVLPDHSRETARLVVQKVVRQIEEKLREPLRQALAGRRRRSVRNRRPRPADIDWHRTIRANLRHYQPDHQTVLPVNLRGDARGKRSLKRVILLVDQSGSMAESVVYAGVMSCILASLPSLETKVVAFDTSVVDLTAELPDPLDLLFAIQLGGGTDIGRALRYAEQLNERPRDTVCILISDLYENGSVEAFLASARRLIESGLRFVPLLTLSDAGAPAYDKEVAEELALLGTRPFACTPDQFAEVLAENLYV